MLEHIGENPNFDLKPNKIKDKSYNKVLNCLRKHLHVIECVLFLIASILYIRIVLSIVCNHA